MSGTQNPVVWVGNVLSVEMGVSTTNYTTILGQGTLSVSDSSGVFGVSESSASIGTHRAILDMSGLNNFVVYVNELGVAHNGAAGANGAPAAYLILAQTNFVSSTSVGMLIGSSTGNPASGSLFLGQTNALFFDGGIIVGQKKANGWLGFNAALSNPTALFRNSAGTGPQSTWAIGDYSALGGATAANKGVVDFSLGTVDAQVGTIWIGHGETSAASVGGNGTLNFRSGTICASAVEIGYQIADNAPANGTNNIDSTAQLIVTNNFRLGHTGGGSLRLPTGVLNIGQTVPGGSVWVMGSLIDGGGVNDSVSVMGGSLRVGGTLGVASGIASQPLDYMTVSNADLTFDLGASPNPTSPLWQINTLTVTGTPITNNVLGIALTPGQFSLIKYVNPIVGDDGSGFKLGPLPSRVSGYLSNNTQNSSIDLVITSVDSPKWNGIANGSPNGNWDINTTADWLTISGLKPTTYVQIAVPGDAVVFDDSAAGTTTVNLTTTLSPAGIAVNNTGKNYTFTGSGGLSRPR